MAHRAITRGYVDSPRIQVFVNGDEHATVAEVIFNDEFLTVSTAASSKRMDSDPYDQRIGSHLALGRALRDAGRAILKDGNDMVKIEARRREEEEILKKIRNEARKKNAAKIRKEMKKKAKEKTNKKSKKKADA